MTAKNNFSPCYFFPFFLKFKYLPENSFARQSTYINISSLYIMTNMDSNNVLGPFAYVTRRYAYKSEPGINILRKVFHVYIHIYIYIYIYIYI
jgi:hypothetical protein